MSKLRDITFDIILSPGRHNSMLLRSSPRIARCIRRKSSPTTVTSAPTTSNRRRSARRNGSLTPTDDLFCHRTDLADCTVIESNNTDWSVFLSGSVASSTLEADGSDLVLQVFASLLAKGPAPAPNRPKTLIPQGSLTGVLPNEARATPQSKFLPRRNPALALRLEMHEGTDWQVVHENGSESVAESLQAALQESQIPTSRSETTTIPHSVERSSSPRVLLRLPTECFEKKSLKRTASRVAELLAHPAVLPYTTATPMELLCAGQAPEVVSLAL